MHTKDGSPVTKILLMAVTTASKLLGVVATLSVLSFKVGAEDFGQFSVGISLAAIISVLIDFGFSQKVLRDIPANPKNRFELFSKMTSARNLVLGIVFFLIIPISFFSDKLNVEQAVFCSFFAYAALGAGVDFYGACLRSIGKYKEEAVLSAAALLITIALIAFLEVNLYVAIFIVTAVRFFQFFILRLFCLSCFSISYVRKEGIWSEAKKSIPYAADAFVVNFNTNADVIIMSYFFGGVSAGIYQSIQKLAMGVCAGAGVISGVFLPKLSSSENSEKKIIEEEVRLVVIMFILAFFISSSFYFFGDRLLDFIYMERAKATFVYITPLAFAILIKYISSGLGVILTARGMQSTRVRANIISLTFFVFSSFPMARYFGEIGILYSAIISSLVTLILYSISYARGLDGG